MKSFSLLFLKLVMGLSFFALSLLGWALKNKPQTPDNAVEPKAWSRCYPLVQTSPGLVSFSERSWKSGLKEEN